jgi:hypothetical protein
VDDLHENGIRLYFGLLALDIIYIFPLLLFFFLINIQGRGPQVCDENLVEKE